MNNISSEFNLSSDIRPNDDFYNHVNKKWISSNKIPDDKNRWGTFDELREESKNNIKFIFDNLETPNIPIDDLNLKEYELLKNLNKSSNNFESIDYKFMLNDFIVKIFNSTDKDDLVKNIFNVFTLNGLNLPIFFDVSPDLKYSNINILHIESGGLGLPDKDYYFSNDKKEILEEYKKFMKKYLSLFLTISDEYIDKILNIEKILAEVTYSNVEKRDPKKMDNPTTFNNLTKNFKYLGLDHFEKFLKCQNFFKGKELKRVNVANVRFLEKYESLFENLDLQDLIHYFMWLFLLKIAPYLNENVCEIFYNFYHKKLGGAKNILDRWERVIDIQSELLGEILGKIYIKMYFSEQSKQRAFDLVYSIKNEFRNRLENNNWMDNKTKNNAISKLDKMEIKIGYPDKFKDYSLLYDQIKDDNSFLKNCLICRGFLFYDDISDIYEEKDKTKWFMNVFEVNAYYSPQNNEIVFPAAILQKPFFSNDYSDSLNYGGIGVVIGHEITHGFDDQGRKFDKEGNLNNWYQEKDILVFRKLTDRLKKQFSNHKVLGIPLNGELTLGENIADLGGVTISLNALKKIINKDKPFDESTFQIEMKDKLKDFFYNYSRVWRINIRDEELKRRLQTDPHSPGIWRVNGILTNINEFYEVFDIKEGQIYINEKDRVIIW